MVINQPQIIQETTDFAVVLKPPKMHSIPQKEENKGTIINWFFDTGYADKTLPDSGLMHRLDYETHGLVLFAKNKKSFGFFKEMQDRGEFIKEYSAIICRISMSDIQTDGFPPPPIIDLNSFPKTIMSYFRPFGPGRKYVRPVIDEKTKKEISKDDGGFYRTEIVSIKNNVFRVRIKRGFRHQIRCHLSWIGFPILNDPLYNPAYSNDNNEKNILALRAHALYFTDPANGEQYECRIPSL